VDPADEKNGCLYVIPYSHKLGILKQSEVNDLVNQGKAVSCIACAGDTLIMRPHIVHRSSKALKPSHRRVIHVEFSAYKLPDGIDWAC
jgi:ectoine hydroxylase-related dioxygenase (phytanoyl-CoA dioxygenase family)